jgi:hypothetical protein
MRNALVKARSGVPWAYRSNTDRAAFTFSNPHMGYQRACAGTLG